MVHSRLLYLRSELTVLKRKAQTGEILESLRKQLTYIHFPTGDTTYISFKPEMDSTDVTIHEYDKAMSIPVEFHPSIRMDIKDAANKLWQVRKHYNAYWRA